MFDKKEIKPSDVGMPESAAKAPIPAGKEKGKMVAQGAHASMKVTLANLEDERVKDWLAGAFTKIVVSVDSEKEL